MAMDETEDGKRLRTVVAFEIRALMEKHDVGGVIILGSRESACWVTVFPKWAGLIPDEQYGMRVRINTKTPEASAIADSTLGLVANIRDMCSDYANVFGRIYRQITDALKKQGAEVEHSPFNKRSHRPDPDGGKVQ